MPTEVEKKQFQKTRLLEELLTTEQRYLSSMEAFMTATQSITGNLIVERQRAEMQKLIEVSHALLKPLETKNSETIANFFIQNKNLFEPYGPYVAHYSAYATALDPKKKLGITINANLKTNTASSIAIEPVQRPPRYVMLLTEILKNTTQQDSDHAVLSKALEQAQINANNVNEAIRKEEYTKIIANFKKNIKSNTRKVSAKNTQYTSLITQLEKIKDNSENIPAKTHTAIINILNEMPVKRAKNVKILETALDAIKKTITEVETAKPAEAAKEASAPRTAAAKRKPPPPPPRMAEGPSLFKAPSPLILSERGGALTPPPSPPHKRQKKPPPPPPRPKK